MKQIDLEVFKSDVLQKYGSEGCLPKNLPDKWLDMISAALEQLLEGDGKLDSFLLYVIMVIRATQTNNYEKIEISQTDLFEYFQRYYIEISLEVVHRNTDMKYEPADMATILTERDVTFRRE